MLLNDVFILELNTEIKKTAIQIRSVYNLGLPIQLCCVFYFLKSPLLSADKALKKVKELDFVLLERWFLLVDVVR